MPPAAAAAPPAAPPRRGRGRPRIHPPKVPGRGRGRPRIHPPEVPGQGRGRGRPRRNPQPPPTPDDEPPLAPNDDEPRFADVTAEEFQRLLRRGSPGQGWTPADEAALRGECADHPLHDALEKRCSTLRSGSAESVLWRNTAKYLPCLPTDIISARRNMVVEQGHADPLERRVPQYDTADGARQAVWSETFCRALDNVLSHRSWAGERKLLTIAIEYTVICATDDRRPWDTFEAGQDESLCLFLERMFTNNQRKGPVEMDNEVFEDFQEEHGAQEEPWWGRLFTAIETLTQDNRIATREARLSPRDDRPYVVRASDLVCLASVMRVADGVHEPADDSAIPTTPLLRKALQEEGLDMLRAQRMRAARSAPESEDSRN